MKLPAAVRRRDPVADASGPAAVVGEAVARADSTDALTDAPPGGERTKRPLYPRLLRLRHVHPNGWQRAVLGEGALALAAVLVLADLASAWTLLVLPVGVALVVKAHDLLAGLLASHGPVGGPDDGERLGTADPEP